MSIERWDEIQAVDFSIDWHHKAAQQMSHMCWDVATTFGSKKGFTHFYQDEVVTIECQMGPIMKVTLTPNDDVVFDYNSGAGINLPLSYSYRVFRIGSWIEHMISLGKKAREIIHQKEMNRREQEIKDKQHNYGRVD